MKNAKALGKYTGLAAAIALISGTALSEPQESHSKDPEQRSQAQEQSPQQRDPVQRQEQQSQAPGVDDEAPLRGDPDVKTGDVKGMVRDGQHADHLHWEAASKSENRVYSDDLIGLDVRSRDDKAVGQVLDLLVAEGRIGLIVEVGGRLGLGGRKLAIPWRAFRQVRNDEQESYLVVDADLETLEGLPEYELD